MLSLWTIADNVQLKFRRQTTACLEQKLHALVIKQTSDIQNSPRRRTVPLRGWEGLDNIWDNKDLFRKLFRECFRKNARRRLQKILSNYRRLNQNCTGVQVNKFLEISLIERRKFEILASTR